MFFTTTNCTTSFRKLAIPRALALAVFLLITASLNTVYAATKTAAATGNWSAAATWSPSGVPASGDDVVIKGGFTVTVDGTYTCRNLNVGDATASNATLTANAAGNLTVTGDVQINPGNKANTFTLDAGAGIINLNGTFSYWSTTGSNILRTNTGTLNITPAVTVAASTQAVTFAGAGTINFYNNYTDSYNKLTTFASCVANFYKNYTVSTTAASWAGKGTAVFKGNGFAITPNVALTLFNIQFDSTTTLNSPGGNVSIAGNLTLSNGATFTANSGSGTLAVTGNITIGSAATFTANKSFDFGGSFTNNGGTFSHGSNTLTFTGSGKTVDGTRATTFGNIQIGNTTAATASITFNVNGSCNNLVFNNAAAARTLTLNTGDTLTVAGDLTINQSTGNFTNQLAVNTGACIVSGNLNFTGTDNTVSRIVKVGVTSGLFRVNGSVNWLSNTVVITEQITVTTGTLIFGSPVSMGSATGTMSVTTGSIYFNGTTAPSFAFGGATTPTFTTTGASNLYFAKGFSNSTNALTLSATSNAYFTGDGAITPNAAITFGNVQFNAGAKDTLATGSAVSIAGNVTLLNGALLKANQGFTVGGNWTNNGGTLSASGQTVILNGTTKTISGTAATAFPILQIGSTAITVSYTMNNNNSCESLVFNSSTTARTLTLGVGDTLSVAGNLTINQATGNVTNQLAVNAGVCNVAGNLIFSGTDNTASRIVKVGVTTGAFTVAGTVTWLSNTVVATEVITVSTGTVVFGSSVTMGSASGTVSVTSTGTIRFNGTTAPSLTFGGATTPVLTTSAASYVYFARGFTNNTNALTFNATCTATFTGNGTITPGAAITFGHLVIDAGAIDTLSSASGTVIVKGDLTIGSGATFNAQKTFEADGNWSNSGTFVPNSNTVIFNGLTKTIGGAVGTTFYNLQMGNTAVALNYTANKNITCTNLVFQANSTARTLALSAGVNLSVTGDVTINQPTAAVTSTLAVNAGTCTISGNLIFAGTSNTTTRVGKVAVTSGSFTLSGNITWMSNTAVATEVITTATGTLNFTNSVSLVAGTGTITATGAGNINFDGTSAPSLNFGGGTGTAPVFTSAYGSNVSFNKGLTATTTALTFAVGSNQIFKGTATITPSALITFGNLQINPTYTITVAGNIAVKGNWNNQGTFVPGTNTVTFNGTGTQTISHTGGETFYKLAVTPFGTVVFCNNDITVTNLLTMSGANIDLNSNTLTLGSSAAASLTYTAGQVYNGTFKRWFPVAAITSTSGSYYGLFPLGTSTDYRPVTINSTVNPTTAGYVSVTHTNVSGGTVVTYTDNEGANIEQITNMHSDVVTSGLAGGTYNIDVKFTDLGTSGSVSNLKLLTYTGSVMGSCGTHATTNGPVETPVGHRTGLTLANLNNAWVIGTNDRNATPMYRYVYSRKSGNWNDVTTGNSTWSYTPGGSGTSCNCLPTSSGYATIEAGHTITVSSSDSVKFIDVLNGGALNVPILRTLTVTGGLELSGTGTFTVNGALRVNNELQLSSPTSPVANGNVTVNGYFNLPTGAAYTQSGGTLSVGGDMNLSGALTIGSSANFIFNGIGSHLSGTGTYSAGSGGTFPITNNKLIMPGTSITIGTAGVNNDMDVAINSTVNNLGAIIINGSLTGNSSTTSIWINNANSSVSATGTMFTNGILDVATIPNTVEYSGSGSQTIVTPLTTYHTLKASNAGTKTLSNDIVVDGNLIIGGSVIIDESTKVISGDGGLQMSGTSELKLSRSTDMYEYPELTGTYSCTGGTVTIQQTADSCVVHGANYYNLKLNGSKAYDLSAVTSVANNLDILSSAYLNDNTTLNVGGTFTYNTSGTTVLGDSIAVNGIVMSNGTIMDGDNSINVYGANGWTRNSAATFTANEGTVYFTGAATQTLGGTATSQTFKNLYINKSAGTVTVGGSTTALNLNGDMTLNSGSFNKGTAVNINMNSGDWICNGGNFVAGTGTVTFSDTLDQAITGTAATVSFNNITVNKPNAKLAPDGSVTTLSLSGNMVLTAGEFDAGTATTIEMTGGNWTNNGATFTPSASNLLFNGTVAQAINGTATTQNFNTITVNKSANTLSVGGSTTALVLAGNHNITAGTFNIGTATTMNVEGNWTMTGGTFTNTGSTVILSGSGTQTVSSTGAFNNLQVYNLTGYATLGRDLTVNGTLTLTNGNIQTNSYKVIVPSTASISGGGAGSYVNGNLQLGIANTSAPSRTFPIGDATGYAPVSLAFVGTTTGSGSVIAYTTAGDDAGIVASGIDSSKSVNRTWTLSNSGVGGFTSYSPTYTFPASDVDGAANTANFQLSRYSGGSWNTVTAGTRTATSTQATGETTFGKTQIGEKSTLTVAVHPADTTVCTGRVVTLVSRSTSLPAPAVKWQRDPNTGTFADITAGMDGSVYSGYTGDTLRISNPASLGNYRYRAVFTNINGSVNSNAATLTVNTSPTITSAVGDTVCDLGPAVMTASASAGVVNWYTTSTDTSIDYTGTTYTTPTISSTQTYYVEALASGCTSLSRTTVVALVTPVPTIATTAGGVVCGAGTVALSATASAGTINWYAASTGGSSLVSGNSYTTPSISTTTNYYVDATLNGCTTASRTAVTATVSTIPTATVSYQSCPGVDGNTTIQIGHTGGTSPFTYKLNTGSFTSTDTVHIGNGSSHNYYVKDVYGCTSAATSYTATTVNPTRIANVGSSATCNCASHGEGREVYLTNSSGDLIAIVNDKGHDLGNITATVYIRPASVIINNNQGGTDAAMSRSFLLDFAGTNLNPPVEVKFPFTNIEYNQLVSAAAATPAGGDDIGSITDIGSTQYEGPTEDNVYNTSDATMLVRHQQLTSGTMLGGKYVTIALTANGEHWLHGNGNNAALPITLVSFTATANVEANQVVTKWVTSLEIDNDYFTLERSEDGVNFTEVTRVDGAGDHTGILEYSYTDTKPVSGTSYYRLKQTDFDGAFTYSNIVSVMMDATTSFTIYPNPTSNQLNVSVTAGNETQLFITDMGGREVYRNIIGGSNQQLSLNLKDYMPAGIYLVNVVGNGTIMKQKLIVNQ